MSWYTIVLDTVREVTKAIGTITGPTLDLKSAAVPYQKPTWDKNVPTKSSDTQGSEQGNYNAEEDSNDGESSESTASSPRITTRARLTYELDRFRKNAMLMFVQIRSNPEDGCRVTDLTMQEVDGLLTTFTSFRFEVDVHLDLTCSEIEIKCQEFFQRDFHEYGAVMVVVLSFEGSNGSISALDGRFSDSVILRHFTTDLNPSLQSKPKIFITEANRSGPIRFRGRFSSPIEEGHQDILVLHIPALYYGNALRRPLLILCDNVNQLADTNDFVTILNKTVKDASDTFKLFADIPIEVNNTFSKEIILARC